MTDDRIADAERVERWKYLVSEDRGTSWSMDQAVLAYVADLESQVSRLREQVAQLEDENEAAGRMINQRDGIIRRRDANLARVEAAMSEAEFHGYDTHDIGRAYCADSVDDLLSDLRAALSPVTQPTETRDAQ